MSILIKGMEMPKNCWDCKFADLIDDEECRITLIPIGYYGTEEIAIKYCPLIELPPHGRLIDADAWIAKVREELLSPNSKKGALETMGAMFRYVLDAPTIIESEKENA